MPTRWLSHYRLEVARLDENNEVTHRFERGKNMSAPSLEQFKRWAHLEELRKF